jgi:hypothetical protein
MHDAMLKTGFNYIVVSFPGWLRNARCCGQEEEENLP